MHLSIQVDLFSQIEHCCLTSTQIKKQHHQHPKILSCNLKSPAKKTHTFQGYPDF